jgi:expansin (peptidoglycan-binding protein)
MNRSNRQVIILHPLAPNGRLDLGHVTDVRADQNVRTHGSTGIDGTYVTHHFPEGFRGHLDVAHGSADSAMLNELTSAIQRAWDERRTPPYGELFEYIAQADGSQLSFKFENVSFRPGFDGQRLQFTASGRRPLPQHA